MRVFPCSLTVLAACLLATAATGSAASRQVDGLVLYFGVLPAAMIQGHTDDSPEEHLGDIPRGPHAYHLTVAVFEAESGARVEDAQVEAQITPLGFAPVRRELEPMQIADTVTYGNFFTLRTEGQYRIEVSILRSGAAGPVVAEFTYVHRMQ
jgi:hypothetical protein